MEEFFNNLLSSLGSSGVKVESDHVMNSTLSEVESQNDDERLGFYKQFLKKVSSSDFIVADVTYPSSLGVGSAISIALDKGKPVLALYKTGKEPHFLFGLGLEDEKLILIPYKEVSEIPNIVRKGLKQVRAIQDIRFNFFVSPKISNYLHWISKEKRVPRSVYLRRLIEEDMKKEKEYAEAN